MTRARTHNQLKRVLTLTAMLANSRWPMSLAEIMCELNDAIDVDVCDRTIRRDLELLAGLNMVRPEFRSSLNNTTVWRWLGYEHPIQRVVVDVRDTSGTSEAGKQGAVA